MLGLIFATDLVVLPFSTDPSLVPVAVSTPRTLAYALAVWVGIGPAGVFWAIAIAYSAQAVFGLLAFRRGTWKTRTV